MRGKDHYTFQMFIVPGIVADILLRRGGVRFVNLPRDGVMVPHGQKEKVVSLCTFRNAPTFALLLSLVISFRIRSNSYEEENTIPARFWLTY